MAKRPNILLLMSDQQRLDTVSAYVDDPICRTPNIDKLANRGVRFDNAFTPTAICSPARASVYTGLYPHNHGVTGNGLSLKPGIRGINDYLDDAGYRCGYAGKWHVDEVDGPSDRGFVGADFMGYAFPGSRLLPGLRFAPAPQRGNPYADYLEENGFDIPRVTNALYGTNPGCQSQEMYALHDGPIESSIEYYVAEETRRLIDELSGDEPFFIWANFWGPHTPCLVPEPYFSMYDPADIPEHPSYRDDLSDKPYRQQLIERMWGLGDYGWEGFQQIGARYFGHATFIDDMVGRIVDKLSESGLIDDTLILYTADHGDCMGAHRLIEKGEFMYDEIYRIPLIAAHPDCVAPGSVNDDFIYLHELAPTFIEAAGLPDPEQMDGHSFLSAVEGNPAPSEREEVYCVFHRHFTNAEQRMVRTRTHQLTFNSGDPGELYDLVADPYQIENVYGQPEYEAVRQDLMARMERYMQDLGDPLLSWFGRVGPVY